MPKAPQASSHSWAGWEADRLWSGEGRRWQWVSGREGMPDEKQVTRQDVETGEI